MQTAFDSNCYLKSVKKGSFKWSDVELVRRLIYVNELPGGLFSVCYNIADETSFFNFLYIKNSRVQLNAEF